MLKRNILRIHACIGFLLLTLISSPISASTIQLAETAPRQTQERGVQSASAAAREAQLSAAEVFERSNAAVARIDVGSEKGRFLGFGSGFIVRADGVILTSFHLIERAHSARVRLANGQIYDQVSIVASEKGRDLAVLKINASNLPFLPFGNSDAVQVGEKVIAIGNPEGLENTISDGIGGGRPGASARVRNGQGYFPGRADLKPDGYFLRGRERAARVSDLAKKPAPVEAERAELENLGDCLAHNRTRRNKKN